MGVPAQPHGALRHFAARVMGSPLRMVATSNAAVPDDAWASVRAEMEATEDVLSRFRPSSELSRLNGAAGTGAWVPASPRLYAMAATAARAWRLSDGLFDCRILRRLEEIGERAGVDLPPPRRVLSCGAPGIERDPMRRALRIEAPIDSGGVGKGLALRWARNASLPYVTGGAGLLVDAGGDIAVAGAPPDAVSWKIGIEDPAGADQPIAVIGLASGSVATSSIAVRKWIGPGGRPMHHLIDPRTGDPGGDGLVAVTVAHPDPAWAEVWSKVLFLYGRTAIGPCARSRGLAAWWVTRDGALEMTPAARALTLWEGVPAGA